MRIPKNLISGWILWGLGGFWCCVSPIQVFAQSQGNNTVYNSSGTTTTGSSAFIDASTFYSGISGSTGQDICTVIQGILTGAIGSYPSTGAVIDARGILMSLPAAGPPAPSQPCSVDPFAGVTVPSTVLLPASTIQISATWILPSNTRLIGEGARYTMLQAISGFSGDMIDMGSSSCPSDLCTGISIEHLRLMGPNPATNCEATPSNAVNGIVNYYAQASSYVSDVSFYGIGLTGLKIESTAPNSGPYSNLDFCAAATSSSPSYCTGGTGSTATCPACVNIGAQTRGLHALTCIGEVNVSGNASNGLSTNGDAAIYVNASNNTIEDLHVEGFFDGVEVGNSGSGTTVGNVVVANVTGGESSKGKVRNTVHICGANYVPGGQFGNCLTPATVSDVSVLGITDGNNGGGGGAGSADAGSTSVQDDVTGTSITPPNGTGNGITTTLYGLGEAAGSGYPTATRFSTSPSAINGNTLSTMVPTWSAGGTMSTIAGNSCSTPGSIYSNTEGGSNTSIYVCTYNGSTFYWQPIT